MGLFCRARLEFTSLGSSKGRAYTFAGPAEAEPRILQGLQWQTFAGCAEAEANLQGVQKQGQTCAGPAGAEAGPRLSPNSAVWPRIGRAHCLEAVVHCAARELQKNFPRFQNGKC